MDDQTIRDDQAAPDDALGSAYTGAAPGDGAAEELAGDAIEDREDDIDDGVIAADDTGMLAGERMITVVELAEGDAGAGSV